MKRQPPVSTPPHTLFPYTTLFRSRDPNGYRTYDDVDMHTLNFIKRARSLGFSVDEVRNLLDLWHDRRRSSAAVKALTTEHLNALDRKIAELRRSEEHTSELQSLMRISYAALCLKKKQTLTYE